MITLENEDIARLGFDWPALIAQIRRTVELLEQGDTAQPLKPYLRYRDPSNRIIAMPAFVGGEIAKAGIKWIASFPGNHARGLPRAHSVTILNDADTGQPLAAINSNLISAVRTAAVSGLLVEPFLEHREAHSVSTLGIVGIGPIAHEQICAIGALMGERLERILAFDTATIREAFIPDPYRSRVEVCDYWQAVLQSSDIFITCTTSAEGYIDTAPKAGSLQLNVSLRDYKPEFRQYVGWMVVDDWDEVCRENTDIERMHKSAGLQQEDVHTVNDIVCHGLMDRVGPEDVIMFNPMGMALFDIAIANYFYRQAVRDS